MKSLVKWSGMVAVIAFAAAMGAAGVSAQAPDKEKAVKDRQDLMKKQGAAMKTVKEFTEGQHDVAKVKEAAATLVATSKEIPALFPQGTATGQVQTKTAAKPDIWSNWQKFLDADKGLESEAEKLVAAASSGDKAKIAEQFAATGKNGCGGCHNTFREKQS